MSRKASLGERPFMSIPPLAFRIPHWVEAAVGIVDSHVHFWNPAELHYPWLDALPSLQRAFLPPDYAAATGRIPIDHIVFVEANCRPEEARREGGVVEGLAGGWSPSSMWLRDSGLGARGSGKSWRRSRARRSLKASDRTSRVIPPASACSARSSRECERWGAWAWSSICAPPTTNFAR